MFSEMITTLSQGHLPDAKELGKRLRLAIVKKMAVIRQPYLFWPSDAKINPPAAHMLWASVIINDKKNFQLTADILVTEKIQSSAGSSMDSDPAKLRRELVDQALAELLRINNSKILRAQLIKDIERLQKNSSENTTETETVNR